MGTYGVKLSRSAPLLLDRHPGASDDFESWCAKESVERPLAVDLFSGAGGLGLGVEQAGWRVVAAVDNDPYALQTHRGNFPGLALNVDMADDVAVGALIERLAPVGVDLVVGGPPCQPFSRAGRSKIRSLIASEVWSGPDSRKDLWHSFVRVVEGLLPRAVVMENVPDMAIADEIRTVREIATRLEAVGYEVEYRLLDAWRHNVPQHRKRLFVQARRDGAAIKWPTPSQEGPTVRNAIFDLPRLNGTIGAREMPSASPGETIYDHMTRPVRDDDARAFALMDEKTLYSDLPEELRRYRADTFRDKYKRLGWDELSRTITAHIAKDGYWYIHPEEHRTITVREAARIQTFPDDFRFAGTRSHAFRQIGNAVPPALGKEVAVQLRTRDTVRDRESAKAQRNRLAAWALQAREDRWWRYPGPRVSRFAAYCFAALDLYRYDDETVQALMDAAHDGRRSLALGATAVRGKLSKVLQRRLNDLSSAETELSLTGAQAARFRAMAGEDSLYTNKRIATTATQILGLNTAGRLLSDSKLEVAMLIGMDELSPLRMTALEHVTASDISG